jgi:hypothetical protein
MMDTTQPEGGGPSGIGGWVLLLSRLLLVWQPLNLAVTAVSALNALALRGWPLGALLLLRVCVTGFGMAAALALQGLRPGAVTMAKAAVAASALTDLLVYSTPYFPNNRPPGDTMLYATASLAIHAIWLAYLFRSVRVRNTFP